MRSPRIDRALLLARQGFLFGGALTEHERRTLHETGGAELTFLGRTALLVTGEAGVELFYDGERTMRAGAVPQAIAGPLFGKGALHSLDDEPHRHRKAMFVELLDPEACERIAALAAGGWRARAAGWRSGRTESLHDAAVEVLGGAIMEWSGIHLDAAEQRTRARQLADIVNGFGVLGPANVRARVARRALDRWAVEQVRRARGGDVARGSALHRVATHTEPDGRRLDAHTAAVELLNILRPTVAVAWLATFCAVALAQHPGWRSRIREESEEDPAVARAFAHEVRRLYPFVPVLAARARVPFEWHGFRVPAGRRILLDVHGTDHGESWADPWAFEPQRFLDTDPMDCPAFVPQGGGDVPTGHRCPGEGVATGLMVETLRALAALPELEVRPEDLQFSMRRMPTRPVTGFRVAVRA